MCWLMAFFRTTNTRRLPYQASEFVYPNSKQCIRLQTFTADCQTIDVVTANCKMHNIFLCIINNLVNNVQNVTLFLLKYVQVFCKQTNFQRNRIGTKIDSVTSFPLLGNSGKLKSTSSEPFCQHYCGAFFIPYVGLVGLWLAHEVCRNADSARNPKWYGTSPFWRRLKVQVLTFNTGA